MNLELFTKEKLWQMLIETVHRSVMYPTHKAYTRDNILPQNADITANELSQLLEMSVGEAIVILDELAENSQPSV